MKQDVLEAGCTSESLAVPPKVFVSLKNQTMERVNRGKIMFVGLSFF
jgi:hypothetical protein